MIGGTASLASVFDFIGVPKPTITQRHNLFQGRSRSSTGCSAAIFLKPLQVECLVFRVAFESSINGVTGITNRNLSDQEVSQKIHQSRGRKCRHGKKGLAPGEEIDAHGDPKSNNANPDPAIEIFLDIECVMAAGYTGCDDALVQYGFIHEDGKVSLAMRTTNVFCR